MRRLLVLRPEPGATATVDRARALGLDAVAVPLFEVGPVPWEAPEPARFDALLLTSANAVLHGGDGLAALRGLPAYAVGEATAEAARKAGFGIAGTGDWGIDRLLSSIAPGQRLLHLAGEDRRAADSGRHRIRTVVVYRSAALPRPEGLAAIAGGVAAVHSPRAGERLAELVEPVAKARVRLACISEAAARAAGSGWEAVESAPHPADEALLALAARLCKNRTVE